jgi:hypothetical protein
MHLFTHLIGFIRGKIEFCWSIYCAFLVTEIYDVKFFALRRVSKIMKSNYKLRNVCLSVLMEQLGSD